MVPSVGVATVCWLQVRPARGLLLQRRLCDLTGHFPPVCVGALAGWVFFQTDRKESLVTGKPVLIKLFCS